MNLATDLIEFEHRKVEGFFERFERSPHRSVAMDICGGLEHHSELESAILHPALARIDRDRSDEAHRQHAQIDELVAEIRTTADRDRLRVLVAEVRPLVVAHVKTQEHDVLPMMEESLGVADMNKLGFSIGDWKREKERSGEDAGELLELTRAELYAKAQDADVRGRSNMNKRELVEALSST